MEFIRAGSVEEALAAGDIPGAVYVAGGTNMVPDVLFGRRRPPRAVDISHLKVLRFIERAGNRVRLGALATVADLLECERVRESSPPLHECALDFAGPLVRNRATVAGNLADASPAADLASPLLAQDAEVEIRSAEGERRLLLADFFLDYRRTALAPGELVTAVSYRVLGEGDRSAYYKFQLRRAMSISVVSVAVALRMDGDRCAEAGIGMGAVAPVPFRAESAGACLQGRRIGDAEIEAAAHAAAEETRPIDDVRASANYRRRMSEVLVRRLLRRALGMPERAVPV